MKAKVYFFRLIVAIVTLAFGVGTYFVWQKITIKKVVEVPKIEQLISPADTKTEPPPSAKIVDSVNPITENENPVEEEFYPDGEYYLVGDLPKGFNDFDYLSIIATEDVIKSDGSSYWKPIPPEGLIFTTRKYKFKRISINNRQIFIETETVKGVSYKFTGDFPKEEIPSGDGDALVAIKGSLSKIKDGKKVAEIEVKFAYNGGC